eukprot:TRINITY_DN6350_c0_g1_i1.p1 TRINITY_DN6350_c0_g1~~TRINITY_DN6350_c0_g1_i1.p1  ORF type:complete len:298 (+),score=70.08 TRINITY_DN6350_c0_g1_i1:324-1217(+)
MSDDRKAAKANSNERTPIEFPEQEQSHPGKEYKMDPEPFYDAPWYKGADKLKGKVAVITGGDSGIGRSVAILFAREGADVCIIYLESHKDAEATKKLVEKEGRKCLTIAADVQKKQLCVDACNQCVKELGRLDILVNNSAVQYEQQDILDITEEQLDKTFRTNIYGYFFMTQAAIPHMKQGSSIINSTSVTAYKGSGHLLDYSSTKGAIRTFTYGLSEQLLEKGIRVNGVAPGPIWTPFIPSTFPGDKVKTFGQQAPMNRAGQPEECAPSYVFLASHDSSYITGQVLHPNGGTIVNA